MRVITGPQSTSEQQGDLAEAAGLHGAKLASDADVMWLEVSALIILPGWEGCSLATADVTMAEALELPVTPLAP